MKRGLRNVFITIEFNIVYSFGLDTVASISQKAAKGCLFLTLFTTMGLWMCVQLNDVTAFVVYFIVVQMFYIRLVNLESYFAKIGHVLPLSLLRILVFIKNCMQNRFILHIGNYLPVPPSRANFPFPLPETTRLSSVEHFSNIVKEPVVTG